MNLEQCIEQLNSLINDRKSFISDDEINNEVFNKDIKAIEYILAYATNIKGKLDHAYNVVTCFKENHIICFDDDLWKLVKKLEKILH